MKPQHRTSTLYCICIHRVNNTNTELEHAVVHPALDRTIPQICHNSRQVPNSTKASAAGGKASSIFPLRGEYSRRRTPQALTIDPNTPSKVGTERYTTGLLWLRFRFTRLMAPPAIAAVTPSMLHKTDFTMGPVCTFRGTKGRTISGRDYSPSTALSAPTHKNRRVTKWAT